jgi:hypothetical protein
MNNIGLKIISTVLIVLFVAVCYYKYFKADAIAFDDAKRANTSIEYEYFIEKHPNSTLISSAFEALYTLTKSEGTISAFRQFADKYPNTSQAVDAKKKAMELCDKEYDLALNQNTIDGWNNYKTKVPPTDIRDANQRISDIENLAWQTEKSAWNQVTLLDNTESLNKYLNLYPSGIHKRQAEKRLIDLEVANVLNGEHGNLPSMDRNYSGDYGSSTSTIHVKNQTSYTLTLLYSGRDSKRIVLSPGRSESITLHNGRYNIAASVDAGGVRNYGGTEQLEGDNYSVTYYISSHY